jgi:hypothetical protein
MGTFSATFTLTVGSSASVGGFNIVGNPGSVSIATGVSRTALAGGVTYTVDDAITEFTITSTGDCTNSITKFVGGEPTPTPTATSSGTGFCFELTLSEMDYQNSTLSVRYTPAGGVSTLTPLQLLESYSEAGGEVTIYLCSETTPSWWNSSNEQVSPITDFTALLTNCTSNSGCFQF